MGMPSSRSSRRAAAIARRQRTRPRQSTREIDQQDRHAALAPLPAELAAKSAADRAETEARRQHVRDVRQQIERAKRAARAVDDEEKLAELDAFARRFERSLDTRASATDRH